MNPPEPKLICINCGRILEEIKCKVQCPRCGYFEDCSDGGNDHPNVTVPIQNNPPQP